MRTLIATAAITLAASVVSAAPNITVGTHHLLPDTPGQEVRVYISGGDSFNAMNLNLQLAEGALGEPMEPVSGPVFEAVDALTGTVLAGRAQQLTDNGTFPQLVMLSFFDGENAATADGLLATLTISTEGVYSGTYGLNLFDTRNGATDFDGQTANIADGFVIVPEPSAAAVASIGFLMLLRRRR